MRKQIKRMVFVSFSLLILFLIGFGVWAWRDAIGRQKKTEYAMRLRIEVLNLSDELKEQFRLTGKREFQALEEILSNFNRRIVKMLE